MQINLDLPLDQTPLVVLDVEATGLYAGLGHRVIEIGALRVEGWQAVGEFNQMVDPGRHIDPKASEVNGIVDADLVGKPAFDAVADDLLALCDGAVIVAHNAVFDATFIGLELWLSGRDGLENPWLDTLQLARGYFYFGRNNLTHIANKLNVRIGRAHRALNDVYMTTEVLKRMSRELTKQGLRTTGDLLHSHRAPIFTPPPPQVTLPDVLQTALDNKSDLEILYIGNDGETTRRITPRYATTHRGDDYLVAYCHLRNAQRTFKVMRIFSAAPIG